MRLRPDSRLLKSGSGMYRASGGARRPAPIMLTCVPIPYFKEALGGLGTRSPMYHLLAISRDGSFGVVLIALFAMYVTFPR